jgi:hypothetical protein
VTPSNAEMVRRADVTDTILARVAVERRRQDTLVRQGKFPWNCAFDGPPYAAKLAVLLEEVGEVGREVVEHGITTDKYAADPQLMVMPPHREEYYRKRMAEELVQVAAVCVAWVEHLSGCESGMQTELEEEHFARMGKGRSQAPQSSEGQQDDAPLSTPDEDGKKRIWVRLKHEDKEFGCTGAVGCRAAAIAVLCDKVGNIYVAACSPSHFDNHWQMALGRTVPMTGRETFFASDHLADFEGGAP